VSRRARFTRGWTAVAAEATIERPGKILIEATTAPAKVILFGSRSRGDGDDRSDFDFLVIEREVDDRFGEMVRLGRLLGRLLIPADVVVPRADRGVHAVGGRSAG
jgi:predicted nucleotidyltransferase